MGDISNLKPFAPGQSGNPGGKPVNARNRLTKAFLENLADDFEANGKAAIELAREHDPMGYIRAVASLMPKELVIERPTDGLTDDQLSAALEFIRSRLAEIDGSQASGRPSIEAGSPKAEVLPAIQ